MKQFFTTLIMLACTATTALAQLTEVEEVKKSLTVENKDTVARIRSGLVHLGVNQGFLHNWVAGGEVASLTVDGLIALNITRLYHRQVWSNTLDASYGILYTQSNNFVPRKIDDRFDFTSKYGTRLDTAKNFYFTGLFNFKTQFAHGYDYSVPDWQTARTSSLFSPAYFTLSAGIEYRKGSDISLFFSPVALRFTTAAKRYTMYRPEGAFGIPYGETSRFECGAYFSGRYQRVFSKTVAFKSRLDLYLNYLAKDRTDSVGTIVKKDNPGNVDIFWDNLLVVKLGKFFALNFALTAIYDNDLPYYGEYTDAAGITHPKEEPGAGLGWWQVKEVMTFGIAYTFH